MVHCCNDHLKTIFILFKDNQTKETFLSFLCKGDLRLYAFLRKKRETLLRKLSAVSLGFLVSFG